jgi:hypothetical protein
MPIPPEPMTSITTYLPIFCIRGSELLVKPLLATSAGPRLHLRRYLVRRAKLFCWGAAIVSTRWSADFTRYHGTAGVQSTATYRSASRLPAVTIAEFLAPARFSRDFGIPRDSNLGFSGQPRDNGIAINQLDAIFELFYPRPPLPVRYPFYPTKLGETRAHGNVYNPVTYGFSSPRAARRSRPRGSC